jgi:hypothetical protein
MSIEKGEFKYSEIKRGILEEKMQRDGFLSIPS